MRSVYIRTFVLAAAIMTIAMTVGGGYSTLLVRR